MTPVLPPPPKKKKKYDSILSGSFGRLSSFFFWGVFRHILLPFEVCRDRAAYFKSTGKKLLEAAARGGCGKSLARWLFQMFFKFTSTWGNDPI